MYFLALAEGSVQLVPDGTIFLHIGLILVMIWALNSTFFKPINRILQDRESRTGGRSGEAREILRDVDEKLSRYEQSLRQARAEGYRLMEQERAKALTERQVRLDAVRNEVRGTIEKEKQSIEDQKRLAKSDLGHDARKLAFEISERILHRPISDRVSETFSQ